MGTNSKTELFISDYLKRFKTAKENQWNYIDGCLMNAVIMLYNFSGEEKYKSFVMKYYEKYIEENGNIKYYNINDYNLDSINSGNGLFFMLEQTHEKKYLNAIELLMEQLRNQPRTATGNFWHKKIYPHQVWLDGLYMGLVFYTKYDTLLGDRSHYEDIVNQFRNVRKYMFSTEKGLYFHACDMAKKQSWANPKTGLSRCFWLRACGWHLMALIDVISSMDKSMHEYRKELADIFKEAASGILKYQDDESGLFYQVVDRKDVKNNYLETSGSAMIAYALLKACRLKILLEEEYRSRAMKIFDSLTDRALVEKDKVLKIGGICRGAGLSDDRNGTVEYYLSEPIVYDDHKGAAPYIMAYVESLRLKENQHE